MISVVIPYYNTEKYIRRCINSLTSQIGDFEFLFVNDQSTDKSEEIVKSLADDRCICLQNEYMKGVSGARNTGIDHATGKFITFLDADDIFLKDAYPKFKEVMGVEANCYQFNHFRYVADKKKNILAFTNKGGWYDTSNLPDCWWGVWNKLFKASFIKDLRFHEGLQYGEDELFIIEYLVRDKNIYHANYDTRIVKHYIQNMQSLGHTKNALDILKQIDVYENLFFLTDMSKEMEAIVSERISLAWKRTSNLLKKEGL